MRAGFVLEGSDEHSTNWRARDGTPIQFTDDVLFRDAIGRAEPRQAAGFTLRVLSVEDLLTSKLTAAKDPARRRSKRAQDIADVLALIEDHPVLQARLSADELQLLEE